MKAISAPPLADLRSRPDALELIPLDRPRVMGILNLTPDSFSDGGLWLDPDTALRHVFRMIGDGADIIDVGGESTRPGAEGVPLQAELDRVIPVIERVATETDIPVSIDTSKPGVMLEAVKAGAAMINDVYALRQEGAVETAASLGVPVCLMHMRGEPRDMQNAPAYEHVVEEVRDFLEQRASTCRDAGIPAEKIVLDPGFGFGKTLEHNLALVRGLGGICELGYPVLAGISRKSMLGTITGRDAAQRATASAAAALLAVQNGAAIVRVHDVAETVDALKVLAAFSGEPY